MTFVLLSIDVGIKNLGICLLEVDSKRNIEKIIKWKIISLIDSKNQFCNGKLKNGNDCRCIGKYKSNDKYYCSKHKYEDSKLEKKIKAGDIDIITLGRNIKYRLDELLEEEKKIDYVVIENQISTIASRMKTIQGMIIQYFILKNIKNIDVISSQNKLKLLKEYENIENIKKTSYGDRKKMGINLTNKILDTNEKIKGSKDLFIGQKKDDLADSFLQGLYYIKYNIKFN